MNREIKFKGKCLEFGNWVFGSLLNYEPCPEIQSTELGENAYDYDKWEVDPDTVCQFTGFKNIYEYDIVLYNGMEYLVENMFGCFYLSGDNKESLIFNEISILDIEVIGNKFDGKEYLNKLKK